MSFINIVFNRILTFKEKNQSFITPKEELIEVVSVFDENIDETFLEKEE